MKYKIENNLKMKKYGNIFEVKYNNIEPKKGAILISEPFNDDYYFKRSVVLLCDHNDNGSMGFILNNFSLRIKINDLIEFPQFDGEISIGGPVNTDAIFYVHSLGDLIPDSIKIKDDLFWGGDLEFIKKLVEQKVATEHNLRFFLGYSGWASGQLYRELQKDFWIVSEMNTDSALSIPKCKTIWSDALAKLGNKYKIWSQYPIDPSQN